MLGDRQDKGSVEGMKEKLYSRKEQGDDGDARAPLTPSDAHAPVSWSAPPPPQGAPRAPLQITPRTQGSFAKKFFIGSVGFFVLAAVAAGYAFFIGGNVISPRNIDLQILAPSLIDGGKEATIEFVISNRNSAPLLLADLLVDLPPGTRSAADPSQSLGHERIDVGTVNPGEQVKRTLNAIFFGQEGVVQQIKTILQYNVPNSNAVYSKEGSAAIAIGTSPVTVGVSAPQAVIAGEPFTITLTARSNATAPVDNVVIEGQYPAGFTVLSAEPKAAGGGLWRLGTMSPGETRTITLRGSVEGQDGDQKVLRFLAGSDADETDSHIPVPFITTPTTLTVQHPFVTGTIAVEGKTGHSVAAPAGKKLTGTVTWRNNLSESVSNVEIRLKFSGPMLQTGSINGDTAFFDSATNSLVWSSQQDPALADVAPGASGTLSFSFATYPPGTGGVVYTNPTASLELSVQGTRQGQDNSPELVSSAAALQVTLSSQVALAMQALHFTGAYHNTGPMPPRAETPTTYSVEWSVRNSSNALANAAVVTVLPLYVTYVAGGTGIAYDASTRTVTWTIGDLKAGAGYSSSGVSGSFQVSLAPSASQVGTAPALTGAAQLSASDRFAGVSVSAVAEAVTTKLSEPGFSGGMDIVGPKQ